MFLLATINVPTHTYNYFITSCRKKQNKNAVRMKINAITSAALEDGASETDLFTDSLC